MRADQSSTIIVISDLHLGGSEPMMMSRPSLLADFIVSLAVNVGSDDPIELVIAGDFIDFLAVPPHSAWTDDPDEAVRKLKDTMRGPCEPVFTALGVFLEAGNSLTVLVGNHDVEVTMPPVQEAFVLGIGADKRSVDFVDDGSAYRIGPVLIEHGNRYDAANTNDWSSTRAIASALSRGERPDIDMQTSAGSRIVEKLVTTVKARYPFVDLIQPAGELTAFLLLAFDPGLLWHVNEIGALIEGGARRIAAGDGQPTKTRNIAADSTHEDDPEMRELFGAAYESLRSPHDDVSWQRIKDWGRLMVESHESLSSLLRNGQAIPADRLAQIRAVLQRLHLDDAWIRTDGDTGVYGAAAKRMIRDLGGEVQVVVMGHTHLARHLGPEDAAWYINTGTWADVVRVPARALEQDDAALTEFLQVLHDDEARQFVPTDADLRLGPDRQLVSARLRSAAVG